MGLKLLGKTEREKSPSSLGIHTPSLLIMGHVLDWLDPSKAFCSNNLVKFSNFPQLPQKVGEKEITIEVDGLKSDLLIGDEDMCNRLFRQFSVKSEKRR